MTFGIYTDSGEELVDPTREELSLTINALQREVERLERYVSLHRELELKIDNVKGFLADYYSENGSMLDGLVTVAHYLDIPLTKSVSGTANLSVNWRAQVPLDFDPMDLQISYSLECDSYEAEDFDYDEDAFDVDGEDD